jgi:hypothetical protein
MGHPVHTNTGKKFTEFLEKITYLGAVVSGFPDMFNGVSKTEQQVG